jgi:hypothetical protein
VYNAANIERVRRDEAAAAAAETAAEERMQEADSARRLAILRGDEPPPVIEEDETPAKIRSDGGELRKRKRKRAGEDDTDFEMRVALEEREEAARRQVNSNGKTSGSVVDARGHIALFESPVGDSVATRKQAEKDEADQKRRRTAEDERVAMRFSEASGWEHDKRGPWYAQRERQAGDETPMKNVFGKDDPGRKEREAARITAGDPLAMMKKGAAKVREVEKERRKDAEERRRAAEELKRERRRDRRRRREDDEDDLEGFSLDGPSLTDPDRDTRHGSRRQHREDDRRGSRDKHRRDRDRGHGRDDHRRHRSRDRGRESR